MHTPTGADMSRPPTALDASHLASTLATQDLCYPEPGPSRSRSRHTLPDMCILDEQPCSGLSTPTSSIDSSAVYSSQSLMGEQDDRDPFDDVVELVRSTDAPLIHHGDKAYDMLVNLWGLVPPRNFGQVRPGLYRSGFPRAENFSFLRTKGIKTILSLVPHAYTAEHEELLAAHGVKHISIGIEPNKDPFAVFNPASMISALAVLMDKSNYPLLVHCNKGKHRTGCVIGCYRKVCGWTKARILEEYRRHAGPKARILDEHFIDMFDERSLLSLLGKDEPLEPFTESPVSALVSTRLRS